MDDDVHRALGQEPVPALGVREPLRRLVAVGHVDPVDREAVVHLGGADVEPSGALGPAALDRDVVDQEGATMVDDLAQLLEQR